MDEGLDTSQDQSSQDEGSGGESDLENPLDPSPPLQRKRKRGMLPCTNEPQDFQFLLGHPQWDNYSVRLLPEDKAKVLNFQGIPLPRDDFGSNEYYHATMLTLFKPWRNRKELKLSDQM